MNWIELNVIKLRQNSIVTTPPLATKTRVFPGDPTCVHRILLNTCSQCSCEHLVSQYQANDVTRDALLPTHCLAILKYPSMCITYLIMEAVSDGHIVECGLYNFKREIMNKINRCPGHGHMGRD